MNPSNGTPVRGASRRSVLGLSLAGAAGLALSPAGTADAATASVPAPATPPTGWTREGAVRFDRPAALGNVAGEDGSPAGVYAKDLVLYGRDWNDTSGAATYDWTRTLTAADGTLRIRCHRRPTDGRPVSAAFLLLHPTLGRNITPGHAVEVAIRVPRASRFGGVLLLWPTSNEWGQGEMDFPEGRFDAHPNAYHHRVGSDPGSNVKTWTGTGVAWSSWHRYRLEWRAGSVRYLVDGQEVMRVSDPAQVATAPHQLVYQCGVHDAADPPRAGEESTVELAYAAFDRITG